MKKIFITVSATVAIVVAISFLAFLGKVHGQVAAPTAPASGSVSGGPTDLVPIYEPPTGATLNLGTSGGSVVMNNFYNTSLGAEDEFVVVQENSNYAIYYDTYNSGFDLDIEQAPFATNRAAAEAEILSLLGISQADACKLTISVSAESTTNSSYSLSDRLPLSFCASSTLGG